MPPITRGLSRARKIWIGVALCRSARGRSIALRQCCKAAVDVVASGAVGLQANRETWTVGLSPRRRGCRNHSYYQNRKRQSTHPGRAFSRTSKEEIWREHLLFPTPDARSVLHGWTHVRVGPRCSCRVAADGISIALRDENRRPSREPNRGSPKLQRRSLGPHFDAARRG